jgi:hypothetical protein
VNRASWSLGSLAEAYKNEYGTSVSRSTISEFFKNSGYKFKKAKKVLTSSDPEFRTKLAIIKQTLAKLEPEEKFFSIDEFGPFSIKMRGGRALVSGDIIRTIPQRQKSKGSLICTAALELSANQLTHFYSKKKNTDEMIKLMIMLINQYKQERRIFLSWDSASWHMSKALYKKVNEVNSEQYRREHSSPLVELLPLPRGAQFLNVIESVFSGMSKAILHNSNYQSVDECKAAIDRYFSDRNRFLKIIPSAQETKYGAGRGLRRCSGMLISAKTRIGDSLVGNWWLTPGVHVAAGHPARAHFAFGHHRHFWHGRWWYYGVGPCWVWSDYYGEYVWACD